MISLQLLAVISILIATPSSTTASPTPPLVTDISLCPPLQPRPRPSTVHDLRPDDFGTIISLGDSITAGLLSERANGTAFWPAAAGAAARGDGSRRRRSGVKGRKRREGQVVFGVQEVVREESEDMEIDGVIFPRVRERRGRSYATGGDEGVVSLGNLIAHYRQQHLPPPTGDLPSTDSFSSKSSSSSYLPWIPHASIPSRDLSSIKGLSYHHHPLALPNSIGLEGHNPEQDGLNAAVSGSTSGSLLAQLVDYVLPGMDELGVEEDEWKFLTINIGSNDVCAFCLQTNSTSSSTPAADEDDDEETHASGLGGKGRMRHGVATGTAEAFAGDIKEVLQIVREEIPNVLVEIIGLFRVSAIYELSMKDPHCVPLGLPPYLPQLPLECSCALTPGPVGDYTRNQMDLLSAEYDAAVRSVVKDLMAEQSERGEDGEGFGVFWQPGTLLDLPNYPGKSVLSPIDCFHPSEEAHERIAAGLWNALVLDEGERNVTMPWWEDGPQLRCLKEEDRIRL